jgi:alanyl-tRNA synthetase
MKTQPAYWIDAYRTELETEVVAAGDGDQPWAVLSDTVLYPEGGGQPGDRGWLGEVAVTNTVKRYGDTVHLVEAPVALGPVQVRLDWQRRFDHMQQHTAQHLLTAIAEDRHGWTTTAFHLGESVSDIELAVPVLAREQLSQLEEESVAKIRDHLQVDVQWLDLGAEASIRCRGLPAGHEGDLRVVEIDQVDRAACGGTHLHSTAEIETICLLGTEAMRGGTRVFFVAGGRVRRRMAQHETRNAELRTLLGAPDQELPTLVAGKLAQIQQLSRNERALNDELASLLAERLAASDERVNHLHFEKHGPELLQPLARRFAASAGDRVALLTSDTGFFVLSCGNADTNLKTIGAEVAEILQGRGGGKGQLFQGKATAVQNYPKALARLCLLLGENEPRGPAENPCAAR